MLEVFAWGIELRPRFITINISKDRVRVLTEQMKVKQTKKTYGLLVLGTFFLKN